MAQRTKFEYDLSKITRFNPALMYGFDPESSLYGYSQEETPYQALLHELGQREDVFNAYHFAQEVILKEIHEKGVDKIAAEDILRFLNLIHQLIAFTLANDTDKPHYAGQYAPEQISRWHKGIGVKHGLQLQFLFRKGIIFDNTSHIVGEHFANDMHKNGVNPEDAHKFVAMLEKYDDDPTLDESTADSSLPFYRANLALEKVTAAYHRNLLSEDEKQLLQVFAKICHPPKDMPRHMNEFAENIASLWRRCDKNNVEQVAELCSQAFFGVTEIHPYFNGNGRTATCFVNIISVSLNHASFLMREPGERNIDSSSYALAIERINVNRGLLTKHILKRIREADKGKAYKNDDEKELVNLRFKTANALHSLLSEFPTTNVNNLWKGVARKIGELIHKRCIQKQINLKNEAKVSCIGLTILLEKLRLYTNELRSDKIKEIKRQFVTSPVVQCNYSEEVKKNILEHLCLLTGLTNWKQYNKNGWKILIEMDSPTNAEKLAESLLLTNSMLASSMLVSTTKKPAVLLENINSDILLKTSELVNWVNPTTASNIFSPSAKK